MPSVTLYYFPPSTPCRAVLMTIRNLNLDVEVKNIDLWNKEQLLPDYQKVNPQHTVPTLVDNDGFILWESRAITAYLVDTKSPDNPLYPKDPKQRALINQRLYFDASGFYPLIRNISHPVLQKGETKIPDDKRKALNDGFQFLDKFLNEQLWVAGSHVTLADISLSCSVSTVVYMGFDLSKFPNVALWYEKCKKLPGFVENEIGAKLFGDAFKSKLDETF